MDFSPVWPKSVCFGLTDEFKRRLTVCRRLSLKMWKKSEKLINKMMWGAALHLCCASLFPFCTVICCHGNLHRWSKISPPSKPAFDRKHLRRQRWKMWSKKTKKLRFHSWILFYRNKINKNKFSIWRHAWKHVCMFYTPGAVFHPAIFKVQSFQTL